MAPRWGARTRSDRARRREESFRATPLGGGCCFLLNLKGFEGGAKYCLT